MSTFVSCDAYLLQLLRDGKVDAEIAVRLGISTTEVKMRVAALCARAGVFTRYELRQWIESLDLDAPDLPPLESTAEPPAMSATHPSRTPVVLRTVASVAAAMACIAGLVSWNERPDAATHIPVKAALISIPAYNGPRPTNTGKDPDAPLAVVSQLALPLPAGTTLLVEAGDGFTQRIERIAQVAEDQPPQRETILSAPANGEVSSIAALPTARTIVATICAGGLCDHSGGGGSAVTSFFRSYDGGLSWRLSDEREGRWLLIGLEGEDIIANRPADGARYSPRASQVSNIQVMQWRDSLAIVPGNRAELARTRPSRPILALPFGGSGRIEDAWWMDTEASMTWTPASHPGSTWYTAIYGSAYGNTIGIVETGQDLEIRGRLAPGSYIANAGSGPMMLTLADATISPVSGLEDPTIRRVVLMLPK